LIMAAHSRRRCLAWRSHTARGGFELALGIHEERAGRDDPLAGRQPARDRHAVAEAAADDHLSRLEISVAQVHEYGLPFAGIEHGFRGDEELLDTDHTE